MGGPGGGGMGGPGGMGGMGVPPTGSLEPSSDGFVKVALDQSLPPSSGSPPNGGKPSRGASINKLLRAADTMSITQNGTQITVKGTMSDGSQTADDYVSGSKTQIPYGKDKDGNDAIADRTAGWRGPVFVVTTEAKKIGTREDDFAIDDDGRLIMTTQTKGGKLGKVEIKRVYDRIRGAQS